MKNMEDCVKYDEDKRKLIISSCGCKVEHSIALQALEVSFMVLYIILYGSVGVCIY